MIGMENNIKFNIDDHFHIVQRGTSRQELNTLTQQACVSGSKNFEVDAECPDLKTDSCESDQVRQKLSPIAKVSQKQAQKTKHQHSIHQENAGLDKVEVHEDQSDNLIMR